MTHTTQQQGRHTHTNGKTAAEGLIWLLNEHAGMQRQQESSSIIFFIYDKNQYFYIHLDSKSLT